MPTNTPKPPILTPATPWGLAVALLLACAAPPREGDVRPRDLESAGTTVEPTGAWTTGDPTGAWTTGDSTGEWTTGDPTAGTTAAPPAAGTPCPLPDGTQGSTSPPNMSLACWLETESKPKGPFTTQCVPKETPIGVAEYSAYCDLECEVTKGKPTVKPGFNHMCLAGLQTGIPAYIAGCVAANAMPETKSAWKKIKEFKGTEDAPTKAECEAFLATPNLCADKWGDPEAICEAEFGDVPILTEVAPAAGVCCVKPPGDSTGGTGGDSGDDPGATSWEDPSTSTSWEPSTSTTWEPSTSTSWDPGTSTSWDDPGTSTSWSDPGTGDDSGATSWDPGTSG
ncbi:MAG: hypothetical protein R3B09_09920 [Nannocystaceae bacterium]